MNTTELYSPRTMLQALEVIPKATMFFFNTFFKEQPPCESDIIDIDVVKGGLRMAPFVHRDAESKTKQKSGFSTYTFKIPYIKEKFVLTAHDILSRQPGEIVYGSNYSSGDRAIMKLAKEMEESRNAIYRRWEWMCAQVMQYGKVWCKGDGVDDIVDFLLPTSHLIDISTNSTAKWTASSTAKPIDNMREWARLLAQKSKQLTDIVLSSDSYDAFMNCSQVTGTSSLFNQNQVNIGAIVPEKIAGGVRYVGRIKDVGADVWTYEAWYTDNLTGATQPMIDSGRVICIDRNARRDFHFGAIKDLKCFNSVPIFPKQWEEEDPSIIQGQLQSAPLPAAHDVEGVVSVKVL